MSNKLPPSSVLEQLNEVAAQLSEGDRLRLLQFAQTLASLRQAKRTQRNQRMQRPIDESWRIGS